MKKILITGVGGPAGKATCEYFREKGWQVIGSDIVPVETLVDRFHIVPRGDDPEFHDAILQILRDEKPALCVSTVSEELPRMARMKEEIRQLGVAFFISDPEEVDLANDKFYTAERLRELDLASPHTILATRVRTPLDVAELFGYPFLAKPRVGRGGRGVNVICTKEEAIAEVRNDIVFQEFMQGTEYDVNLFAYPSGYTRAASVLLKTALKNGIVGNAVSVHRVVHLEVAELAINAIRLLRLEGPIDMDIRLDHLGTPHILEINARVGANVLVSSEVLDELATLSHERMMIHATPHTIPS
jgi:carbamoylphosphate synthase large subunit